MLGAVTAIETDYLVIGAGAMGMAFVDTLLTETDASVVLVDAGHQPGGHWNVAYPFVRLHQPSAYYGVNSRPLGSGFIDRSGWNAGFYELASVAEVCAYFDGVMREQLLPTGRLTYHPMSKYLGDKKFRTLGGDEYVVTVRRRIVDATYLKATVPSMRPAPFFVADGVEAVAPNDLPRRAATFDHYTIVGAGKTGIDACLWLLRNGVVPERLRWIVPRDSWLMNRATVQPGAQFAPQLGASFANRRQDIAAATSPEDLFERLERSDVLWRVDPAVQPTMYHCAIVSGPELEQLRRVEDVVRLGHLTRAEADQIVLRGGEASAGDSLYVDCTASGLPRREPVDVFDGARITLQSVRGCQQVFSAALIAHLEATDRDDAARNELTVPVPHPDVPVDWLRIMLSDNRAQIRWLRDIDLSQWLDGCRLNLVKELFAHLPEDPEAHHDAVDMIGAALVPTNDQLVALMGPT
jgi:hypothetical protein